MYKNQIKKHKNKNDYFLSDSRHWVRDFTKPMIKEIDINNLIPIEDMKIMLNNEIQNQGKLYQRIDSEEFEFSKIVIINDGYDFDHAQDILNKLPNDVIIIGVNGTIKKWRSPKRINYYVVNNPYKECMNYLPNGKTAKCIASTRTYSEFLKKYHGLIYTYTPAIDEVYSGVTTESNYFFDDYRNPICAAITLSYFFKVKKLMLLSLLDVYDQERPGTEKVKNWWIYPQQKMSHSLIDANLHWLQKAKINVVYNDIGPDYKHSTYINDDMVGRFFQ